MLDLLLIISVKCLEIFDNVCQNGGSQLIPANAGGSPSSGAPQQDSSAVLQDPAGIPETLVSLGFMRILPRGFISAITRCGIDRDRRGEQSTPMKDSDIGRDS